jgi:hypothetical protein
MAVNLDFAAAGVIDADEPIRRDVTRERKANPFEAPLLASFEQGSHDDKGKFRGATKQVEASSDEQAQAIVRALRLAGKNLRVGVKISAPSEQYTDEKSGNERTRYLAGTIKFEAKELTERKASGNGNGPDADAEQSEEEYEDA